MDKVIKYSLYFNDENACLENHARLTTDGTANRPSDGHEEGCISDIKGEEPEKKEKEMGQQKRGGCSCISCLVGSVKTDICI